MFYGQNKKAISLLHASPRFYCVQSFISLIRNIVVLAALLSFLGAAVLLRVRARPLYTTIFLVLSFVLLYFSFMLELFGCLSAQGLQSSVKIKAGPMFLIKKTGLLLIARLICVFLKIFYLVIASLPIGLLLCLYFLLKAQGLIFIQSQIVTAISLMLCACLGIRLLLLSSLSLSLVDDIVIAEKSSPFSAVKLSRRLSNGALREMLFARTAFLPWEILSAIPFFSAFAEGYRRLSSACIYTGLKKQEHKSVLFCSCSQNTREYK